MEESIIIKYDLQLEHLFFSRGLVRVDTVTYVVTPGPTLVKAVTKTTNSVPSSRSLSIVKLVSRPVLALVEGCDESVGLKDTSYSVMIPLGLSGGLQVILILKKEGNGVMTTGLGARGRGGF